MSDPPPCVRAPHSQRILSVPLSLSLALAMAASGCSPGPATSQVEGGTTSNVPEIAKRQKHMDDMLKKTESKAKAPAKSK